ncbi:hypothetical protein [Oceanivirga salmonicida]|uniref:hypothetical protein n=1 Tax=Oceanivirga salmonicida TaxID=1769291 RepID=UPI0012E1FDAC|nr:hypothetical protein [Oceanivirga salmonicida]
MIEPIPHKKYEIKNVSKEQKIKNIEYIKKHLEIIERVPLSQFMKLYNLAENYSYNSMKLYEFCENKNNKKISDEILEFYRLIKVEFEKEKDNEKAYLKALLEQIKIYKKQYEQRKKHYIKIEKEKNK